MTQDRELAEVIAFLLGEAEINGKWFGDRHPGDQPYWWRKHLRAAWNRRTPAGEDARDAERYRRWRLLAASGTMSEAVCEMMIAARTEADVDAAIDASMPAAGIAQ